MKLSKHLDPKTIKILKIAGLSLAGIIVVVFAIQMVGSSFNYFSPSSSSDAMYAAPRASQTKSGSGEVALYEVAPGTPSGNNGSSAGSDAEALEVTEYNAQIKTRHLDEDCAKIAALKVREDVIFERADKSKTNCYYSFKAKRDSAAEILATIKTLDPKEINEDTYTIKDLVDNYSSEIDILQSKKATIELTLANAIKEYDDITALAAKNKDAASLANIIDSKITIIEKLTQESIDVNAELARLDRSKADQLDRLNYTYFNVNINENKFVNWSDLKDSWTEAIKAFVSNLNNVFQGLTVGLLLALFYALEIVIYIFLILIAVKYLWRAAKYIWKK